MNTTLGTQNNVIKTEDVCRETALVAKEVSARQLRENHKGELKLIEMRLEEPSNSLILDKYSGTIGL